MTEPVSDDDRALVDRLDEVWASMAALGAELSEAEWKQPTEVPGWTVQDNLVHISGLEWVLLGRDRPEHEIPDDLAHVKNDVGRSNEVWVDSRRSLSGADALAEFREVTGARLEQLGAYGPGDFAAESWTPLGPGTVRDLLPFRIFDSWVHEQDMRRAVGRAGNLDSPAAELALGRMISTMPFIVGKKAGAPEGATVVYELSGPLARTLSLGVVGGRARFLDDVPARPTARILTDTETFERAACGRTDPATALADGRVLVDGDVALATRIVEESNFLF